MKNKLSSDWTIPNLFLALSFPIILSIHISNYGIKWWEIILIPLLGIFCFWILKSYFISYDHTYLYITRFFKQSKILLSDIVELKRHPFNMMGVIVFHVITKDRCKIQFIGGMIGGFIPFMGVSDNVSQFVNEMQKNNTRFKCENIQL